MNRPSRRLAAALALSLLIGGCRKTDDGTIRLNGRIEAPTVDLAPKVAGRVVEVKVREGDRVSQGDLLVLLDLGETSFSVERDRDALGSAEMHHSHREQEPQSDQ